MDSNTPSGRSYWDLLGAAVQALDRGDFTCAERDFELAREARSQSPGRVFITEKISDGLSRLLRGQQTGARAGGRWEKRCQVFRQRFLQEGDRVVRAAVRLAELRPEDDAETNQPVLETALFLVGRSKIFSEESASAVPLLKGLFRTAGKTGHPFDVQLVRHDIPLTEEDRLWLARKGPEMLEEFVTGGALSPGSPESESWVRTILQLLHPRYFGTTGRLEEERAWLEAITADRLLGRSAESVELYRAYLKVNPEPGVRSDEARVRLLELLANIADVHFPVPLYDQALGAMQSAGLSPGSAVSDRYQAALERMEFRRPDPEPGSPGTAWASAGLETDGRVAVVFWWGDQPRDVAFWSAGDDPQPMVRFLEPCAGRIVATEPAVVDILGSAWEDTPAVWTIRDFACAFLEPLLPDEGLDEATFLKIGLGQSGSWRQGWRQDLGHALLDPPRRSDRMDTWRSGTAAGALLGGLVWQAVLARIGRSDPSLRAGIGAMSRRGDPAARFLYEFLNLDQGLGQSMDASFQPWTLPLLWTRPDPFDWATGAGGAPAAAAGDQDFQARPDLGNNDLAIVTTGDPAAVLAAWGDGRRKWRVVLDRLDRLAELARVAVSAIGPVTLIPAGGQLHALQPALDLLEKMLSREGRPAGRIDGLLPLFHWLRLVETHNGDLLDAMQVRPRSGSDVPLYRAYRDLVADLPLVEPELEAEDRADPWATQFAQRVRKAGLVAGLADGLVLDTARLDSLWGVFEGSDVSWVFLDSAAIHWYLLSRQGVGIQELHALLQTRGHRHLSLLTGAIWLRSELEDLLGTWLGVFGSPYCLALTNLHPPLLRLADQGVVPDAVHLRAEAHAASVAQVTESVELAGSGTVMLPAWGTHRDLWRAVARGELALAGPGWRFLDPGQTTDTALPAQECAGETRLLLVPVLDSLSDHAMPLAQEDSPQGWARADQDRSVYLMWRRRLCGLEISNLLAGPWETVEVLDCRWWRILEAGNVPAEPPQEAPAAWSGEKALAVAAPDGCRLFHLPGLGAGQARNIHPNIMEAVRQWLARRGESPPPPARELPEEGKVLLSRSPLEQLWGALSEPVARAWERGRVEQWLLLVSERVPEQGAAMVAAGYAPGLSVWTGGRTGQRPAPILWCRAADLDDPVLREYLGRIPPSTVLALDVQDWLPAGDRTGQAGATALRVLLDVPASRLVLQARELTPPWISFLTRETGAHLLERPGEEAEPAVAGTSPSTCAPQRTPPLPDAGDAVTAGVVVRRMRRLLENLGPALAVNPASGDPAGEARPPADRQLVSLDQLSQLAGLSPERIATSFRLLRWVARFSGDALSDAGASRTTSAAESQGHSLLVPRRFAEIEHQLDRLQQQLAVLFPLLLGGQPPGLPVWFDLEFPPAQLEAAEMALLDGFLAAAAAAPDRKPVLIYTCPRGTLNSTRRLVGIPGLLADSLQALQHELAIFRSRLKDVMGSAVETGEGFLVETGLQDLRADERHFLATGAALGFWRWLGPAGSGALHLVDLLTTAGSPTVCREATGWDLLAEHMELQQPAADDAFGQEESGEPGDRERGRWTAGGLRAILAGSERSDEVERAARQVAGLVQPQAEPGLLVVAGLAGTGRNLALARGLDQAFASAGTLGEITVFSPDSGAAAHFLARCRHLGPWAQVPEIRVIGPGEIPPRPVREHHGLPGAGADALIIILEIQRFAPEVRYQIAQLGRGRRLVMTVDPAAATEPWEHLFLTVPRTSEVVRLLEQRSVSRRIWSEVQHLLPDELRGKGHSLNPHKGGIQAVYAVNLDQCLTRLVQEVEEGDLPDQLRLVGPLASDLEFLANSLRDRGWLAVDEDTLDALRLPGAREILAAAACVLARNGVLARAPGLADEGASATEHGGDGPFAEVADRVLARCLGRQGRRSLAMWCGRVGGVAPDLSLRTLLGQLEREPWLQSVLADPAAASRARELIERLGGTALGELPRDPLWSAWWATATAGEDELRNLPRRPLVTLAVADRFHAGPTAAGVYLCLGTELPRQHVAILSRLTDQVLILYKEQSPLAAEAGR